MQGLKLKLDGLEVPSNLPEFNKFKSHNVKSYRPNLTKQPNSSSRSPSPSSSSDSSSSHKSTPKSSSSKSSSVSVSINVQEFKQKQNLHREYIEKTKVIKQELPAMVNKKMSSLDNVMLTSLQQKIKRDIGQSFHDILQFMTFRLILEKEPQKRNLWEKEKLLKLLRRQPYF